MAEDLLKGGIAQNEYLKPTQTRTSNLPETVKNSINNMVKSALFLETLRNINWSRGYCWFCEMDGVPNPFQRGGVIGLPVRNINFQIAEGTSYSFNTSSVDTLEVPRTVGNLGMITIDMFDDEQQTLARFFERWYNQVYNPYNGVLPVTEAVKQITIYKQKSTRRNVKRAYYNIDNNSSFNLPGFSWFKRGGSTSRMTEGYDFLVYPVKALDFNWSTDANELNTLSVSLTIAHFCNQDFGNPVVSNGYMDAFGKVTSDLRNKGSWLDKLANFI